ANVACVKASSKSRTMEPVPAVATSGTSWAPLIRAVSCPVSISFCAKEVAVMARYTARPETTESGCFMAAPPRHAGMAPPGFGVGDSSGRGSWVISGEHRRRPPTPFRFVESPNGRTICPLVHETRRMPEGFHEAQHGEAGVGYAFA